VVKVAVVGSRNFHDLDAVRSFVSQLSRDDVVVSGGAYGVDRVAYREARRCNILTEIFYPDWDAHGKKAGFLRNRLIVEAADEVHAFWDGESSGTKSTIQLANAAGKPVHIHR
jgi:predicted Rossmann fold nucleotide-binding protein DprA/Smf involved in DNA uptake